MRKVKIIAFMLFALAALIITSKITFNSYAIENPDSVSEASVSMSVLAEKEFPTDSEEIDISYYQIPVDDITFGIQLRRFPNLKKVIMCDTGYTNEMMEGLMARYPDIEFVWMLHFSNKWKCRTDAKSFSTMQQKHYTTTIGNKDAAQFKYCTQMEFLDIGHNTIYDVSFLQYMPELHVLIVHENYDYKDGGRIRDLSYLKYCPKITYLEIFYSDISDLSFLQYTPELRDLYASQTPISDITYLMDLPHLERLFIQATKISQDDYFKLKERYPDAKILYYGLQNVWENGWRNHPRYAGLFRCIRGNTLDPLFYTSEELEEYNKKLEEEARLAELSGDNQ